MLASLRHEVPQTKGSIKSNLSRLSYDCKQDVPPSGRECETIDKQTEQNQKSQANSFKSMSITLTPKVTDTISILTRSPRTFFGKSDNVQ